MRGDHVKLIVDAHSIMETAYRLTGNKTLSETLLLRLVYKVRALTHPSAIVVFRSVQVPFNNTIEVTDAEDILTKLEHSNTIFKDTVILSSSPTLLGVASFVEAAYRPTLDHLEVVTVTHDKIKKEIGYDPLDIPYYSKLGITTPERNDKAKAGRERASRLAWIEADRSSLPTLKTVADNLDIKVGRSGFTNFEVVQNIPSLLSLLDKAEKGLGWDTEATGLDWYVDDVVGESFSIDGFKGYYLPTRHVALGSYQNVPYEAVVDLVHPRLREFRLKGAHLAFDLLISFKDGNFPRLLEDIQGYGYMLGYGSPDPSQLALKKLTNAVLGEYQEEFHTVTKGGNFADVPIDRAAPYAADDAVKSFRLAEILRGRLEEYQVERYDTIEMPFLYSIIRMMYNGMYINLEELEPVLDDLKYRTDFLRDEIYALAGKQFDLASPTQVSKVFFEELDLPHTPVRKTGFSTAKDDLERIAHHHPIIGKFLERKELETLSSKYLTQYPTYVKADGRIHTEINPFFVITGRVSSSSPNLMNIPVRTEAGRRIRRLFQGQGDRLLGSGDAAQLEYRILAHRIKNAILIGAFSDESRDVHKEMASIVFNVPVEEVTQYQRDAAKTVVYAIIYGAWVDKIAKTLNTTEAEARRIMSTIHQNIPEIAALKSELIKFAREHGYVLSELGHRVYINNIRSKNSMMRQGAERTAFDGYFQGTASGDITKIATIRMQNMLDEVGSNVLSVMQIHDELLVEGYPHELEQAGQFVIQGFENALKLEVPIKAKFQIGKTWGDIH